MKVTVTQVSPQFTIEVTGINYRIGMLTSIPPGFRNVPNSRNQTTIYTREVGNSTPSLIGEGLREWIKENAIRFRGNLAEVDASLEVPVNFISIRPGKRTKGGTNRK